MRTSNIQHRTANFELNPLAILVSATDAASYLGITEETLRSLTRPRGPIPCVRVGRGAKYTPANLREYFETVPLFKSNTVLEEPKPPPNIHASEIRALERRRESLRVEIKTLGKFGGVTHRSFPAVPGPMWWPDHRPIAIPRASGVYFLWDCRRVAYVGEAVLLSNRITGDHATLRRILKSKLGISWIEVPERLRTLYEAHFIEMLQPSLNIAGRDPSELRNRRRRR